MKYFITCITYGSKFKIKTGITRIGINLSVSIV